MDACHVSDGIAWTAVDCPRAPGATRSRAPALPADNSISIPISDSFQVLVRESYGICKKRDCAAVASGRSRHVSPRHRTSQPCVPACGMFSLRTCIRHRYASSYSPVLTGVLGLSRCNGQTLGHRTIAKRPTGRDARSLRAWAHAPCSGLLAATRIAGFWRSRATQPCLITGRAMGPGWDQRSRAEAATAAVPSSGKTHGQTS